MGTQLLPLGTATLNWLGERFGMPDSTIRTRPVYVAPVGGFCSRRLPALAAAPGMIDVGAVIVTVGGGAVTVKQLSQVSLPIGLATTTSYAPSNAPFRSNVATSSDSDDALLSTAPLTV